MKRKLQAAMLILCFLVLTGCSFKSMPLPGLNKKQPETEIPDIKADPPEYDFTQLPADNTLSQDYPDLAEDLSNVVNLPSENESLTEQAGIYGFSIERLKEYGFCIVPGDFKEFYRLYQINEPYPLFITTDSVLHTYHVIFNYLLQKTEKDHLVKLSKSLAEKMLKQSITLLKKIKEEKTYAAALKNVAYFGVAAGLLNGRLPSNIPKGARVMAQEEIQKINSAHGIDSSSILPYELDYSQFKPRGHYTRQPEMERYFKVMMWFGNVPLPFEIGGIYAEPVRADEQIVQSILMTYTLFSGDAIKEWNQLYEITSFFVGESDDLTPYDYLGLIEEVYGTRPDINSLWQDDKLELMLKKSEEAHQPLIGATIGGRLGRFKDVDDELIVVTPQFRFMGQRYILDSEIFYQLTYVGPEGNRPFPKGLDFPAALGSARAYDILTEDYREQDKWQGYLPLMEKMKEEIKNTDEKLWKEKNIYMTWIWALSSIIQEDHDYYPSTLKGEHWQNKQLNTFLGSWAEIRHDTLLYAKQSEPAAGAAAPENDIAYVEPNISFYERMAYLLTWIQENLSNNNLLDNSDKEVLKTFIQLVELLRDILLKQIQGQIPTEEEYSRLKGYGYILENIYKKLADRDSTYADELLDEGMAVIADVHNYEGQCLEVGVGNPDWIYVLVPIEGEWYLTRGGVYSYYEFLQPISNRLTDEQWKEMINSGNAPERESWIKKYIVYTTQ